GSCRIVPRRGGGGEALRRGSGPSGRNGGRGRIEPRSARGGEEGGPLRGLRDGLAGVEVLGSAAGQHRGGAASAGALNPGHDAVLSGERRLATVEVAADREEREACRCRTGDHEARRELEGDLPALVPEAQQEAGVRRGSRGD